MTTAAVRYGSTNFNYLNALEKQPTRKEEQRSEHRLASFYIPSSISSLLPMALNSSNNTLPY